MFEKVNPCHPDKLADRIAGAIVDLAYEDYENPKIAVEVLLGHGKCHIIVEAGELLDLDSVRAIVKRIANIDNVDFDWHTQDDHLRQNQQDKIRCGDNGIFKGMPTTPEQRFLAKVAQDIFRYHPFDGKYIVDRERLIICQSNAKKEEILLTQFHSYGRYIFSHSSTTNVLKDKNNPYLLPFLVGGLFEVIMKWLDEGMATPPEKVAESVFEIIKYY